MTDIGLMVRSANPVPDDSQALTDDELSTVLLLAQQRSGDMDTKERITQPQTPPRWRGWAIAAASFAAVVLVVGVVWLLSGMAADETPPATTPTTTATTTPASTTSLPPTTTVAPAASEADVVATLAVWNEGTEEAVRSTLADGARVDPSMLDEIVFWTLVGQEWTVVECSTDSTPTIRCTTENVNPLYEAVGYGPWVWELSMRVEDGAVTSLSASPVLNRPDLSDDFAEAWFGYRDWLVENHPEVAEAISFPLEPGMAGPFLAHLAEFAEAAESS